MYIYIKEWADRTATIMIKDECSLWTFKTADEAASFCRHYYDMPDVELIPFQRAVFIPAYPLQNTGYVSQQ
ncbi:MAG: hypothetical protein OEY29_11540 [Gammaproteobacteria bacterium]|nr:hypothetical protein [Gammaproteobacteria bacterium]